MEKTKLLKVLMVIVILQVSTLILPISAETTAASENPEQLREKLLSDIDQKIKALQADKASLLNEETWHQTVNTLSVKNIEPDLAESSQRTEQVSDSYELSLFDMSLEELLVLDITSATLTDTEARLTPAAVTTITKEQIYDSGARSLLELMDIYVPNFQWILHWQDPRHVGARGIISNLDDKYLLLVNGKVMNEKTDFGVITERDLPMLSDIHKVEVIRGPGSAMYGPGALAMVVNIITESARTFEGEEILARGGAVERFASFEFKSGRKLSANSGLYLYAGASEYSGSAIADSPIVLGRDNQTYMGNTYNVNDKIRHHFADFNASYKNEPKVKLFAHYFKGNFDMWFRHTEGSETIDDLWPRWDHGMLYKQSTVYASYKQEISSTLDMTYALSYDRTALQKTAAITRNHSEEELYAKLLANWTPKENHKLAAGVEFSRERFGGAYNGEATHWIFWQNPQTDNNTMQKWHTDMQSVFGEYQWNINDMFTFFGSGRLDKHTYTKSMFSPRGALVIAPTEKDTFKLIASKSSRTNSNAQMKLEYDRNNNKSKAEELEAYEARYERQHSEDLWFAGSAFLYDHDMIAWSGTAIQPVGNVDSWGWEAELKYNKDKLSIDASHSYTKMLDVSIDPGVTLSSLEFTSKPMGYGENFAYWSNHQTKIAVNYKLNDRCTLTSSLYTYWGYPGAEDWAEYRGSQNSAFYKDGYDESFQVSMFLNAGLNIVVDENTMLQLYGYNLLGLYDEMLNSRHGGNASYWAGHARIHAPAAGFSLKRKF